MALRKNAEQHRYELDVDGDIASLYYRVAAPGVITLAHTEVPEAFGGRGIGSELVREVLDDVRAQSLKVVARSPLVAAYMAGIRSSTIC